MGFLNETLNKQVVKEATEKGYVKSLLEVSEVFTKLTNDDWKDFLVEGQVVDIVDSGTHMDVVGVNESGDRYSLGIMQRTETEYRHGIVLYPKIQNKRLYVMQPILLHQEDRPPMERFDSLKLRERSGKSKIEKTAHGLQKAGKSMMPLTYAVIVILVLVYMCM